MLASEDRTDLANRFPTTRLLQEIQRIAMAVASPQTCYPADVPIWTKDDPLVGHCGAVAYTVQRLFGGAILSGVDSEGIRWLWNELPNGVMVAATEDNFLPRPSKGRVMHWKTVNPRFKQFSDRVLVRLTL